MMKSPPPYLAGTARLLSPLILLVITRRLSLLICPDGAAACMPSVRRFDKLVARISGQVCSIDEEVQFVAKDAVRLPVAIQYQGTNEVMVELCRMDYDAYRQKPTEFPTLRDLESVYCPSRRQREVVKLSELVKRPKHQGDSNSTTVEPAGLIFHESPSSVILTSLLASASPNLVMPEPSFLISAIEQCRGCSDDQKIKILRDLVVGALPSLSSAGQGGPREFTFLSFGSHMITAHMDLLLRAFPASPWIYFFESTQSSIDATLQQSRFSAPACLLQGKVSPASCAVEHVRATREKTLQCFDKYPEQGRVAEINAHRSVREFVDLLVPGHFGVALSDQEKDVMLRIAADQASQVPSQPRARARNDVSPYYQELRSSTKRRSAELHHMAGLKHQEARVYSRTGSRFVDLPHCPYRPEAPPTYKLMDLIEHWNPDDSAIPPRHYNTMCRFNYQTEYSKALAYRDAEVPFILYNVPGLDAVGNKWSTPGYLSQRFGDQRFHVEISRNNDFMYYDGAIGERWEGWSAPTQADDWTFDEWLATARANPNVTSEEEHVYMRLSSSPATKWLWDDLKLFSPDTPGLIIRDPKDQRGIHCRFAMRGAMPAAHFDSTRNMVAMITGKRRWFISPPTECHNTYLYPMHHPSERHTEVDWSQPDFDRHPRFAHTIGHEAIVLEGEVLYLPAFWIHNIMTLEEAYQCNSRSGDTATGLSDVIPCGFYSEERRKQLLAAEPRKRRWVHPRMTSNATMV